MRNSDSSGKLPYAHIDQPRLNPLNVLIGIAISLLLHSVLVIWSWNMRLPGAEQARTALRRPLEVRLLHELPPLPQPVVQPIVQPQEVADNKKARHSLARLPQPAQATTTLAITPSTTLPENQMPTEKHLDMEAIHANLGAIVAEVDREKRDTPVGQLLTKPLYAPDDDNKIGKAIRGSTRSDCRDQIAGTGLLAPLFLLAMVADKKDSGCKW
ncbi:MAG TPA: hypothetical protein VK832_14380 [Burkholderiaceae bacterium]|nr:hypothetical protein [Burkholderiaceae bacterium]